MTTIRKCDGKVMDELFIEIGQGPICPLCQWWQFDDWWLDRSALSGGGGIVDLTADIRCDECAITFAVTKYIDGETHSSYRRAPSLLPQHRQTEPVSDPYKLNTTQEKT